VTVIGAPQVNELRQAPLYVAEGPTTSTACPDETKPSETQTQDTETEVAAPPSKTAAPTVRPGTIAVPLGVSTASGDEVSWVASTAGSPHLFVLGITGQGKSWTILRLLGQVSQQIPILVLDFHGEYARQDTPFAQTVAPLVVDVSKGLPFSPLEATNRRDDGASYWKLNSLAVAEIVEYVCGLGEIQKDLLYRAVRDTYHSAGYVDSETTQQPQSTCPTIGQVMERLEELESRPGSARNVVARCRPLFEFGLFRSVGTDAVPFSEVVKHSTVLDLHTLGHQTLQNAAGAFVLRKLYKDMFGWGETDRLRLLVILDEAHRLARDITLPLLMKEGRKFGVAVVLASQSPADFHRDVIGNAGTRIVFRMNYPESRQAAKFLTPRDTKLDLCPRIEQLRPGQAYVQTLEGYQGRIDMYPYRSTPRA
jgi:DNA helicase HerA-like ATPase